MKYVKSLTQAEIITLNERIKNYSVSQARIRAHAVGFVAKSCNLS
jgi:hypothetical protein